MIRKYNMLFIVVVICLLIEGCSGVNFFDIQSTMRPPNITGVESDIKQAVSKEAGEDVIWKYPRRGEYRSSIILFDINGDGNDEAVVFYSKEDEKSGIYMLILHNINNSWKVMNKFYNECYGLDKVIFGKLKVGKGNQIIVGYRLQDKIKNHMKIYDCDNDNYNYEEVNNGYIYNDFSVFDFDRDEKSELMVLSTDDENYKTSCQYIKFKDNEINVRDTLEINREIVRYENLIPGRLNSNYYGIFWDYRKSDGAIETEVFYIDDDKLRCTFESENRTKRVVSLFCKIISDDIVWIPLQVDMKLESDNKSSSTYMIEWSSFNDDVSKMHCRKESICGYNIGYNLFISSNWKGRVAYKSGENLMHEIFYEIIRDDNGNIVEEKKILEIMKLMRNEWQSMEDRSNYTLITEQNEFYYVAEIMDTNSDLHISKEYIIENFSLLNSN